jgi:hypothetical protein
MPPLKVLGRDGEAELVAPGEEGGERDLGFRFGEGRAEASVDAVAEGEVALGVSVEVELVGIGEAGRVAVGSAGGDEHGDARWDLGAAERECFRAEAEGCDANRGIEAQQFV